MFDFRGEPSHFGRDQNFFQNVWDTVARIPVTRVTTYGHIAEYLGSRSASRAVGWALKAARDSHLPCHRVVNRYGALTGAKNFGDPHMMEKLLRMEGVMFDEKGCVILSRHLWIPGNELQ